MEVFKVISKYIGALGADQYLVQLAHPDGKKFKPFNVRYSSEQLIKSIGFLRHKNLVGYNIYARPIGYRFVLVDDVKKEMLGELATVRPAVLLETSPNNFQAFLIFPLEPENRDQALSICRQVCDRFDADPGSAEPDHVGRLPGFTNRKEKYRNEKGLYPFVRLRGAENRITTFLPLWGGCGQILRPHSLQSSVQGSEQDDRSIQDFNTVCMLLSQKKPDEYIRMVLLSQSLKAQERGDKYVELTISNARKKLSL